MLLAFVALVQCSQATLAAAWKVADIAGKWAASAWAKKIAAQKTRANLTDLDRFKLMVARKTVREVSSCDKHSIFVC